MRCLYPTLALLGLALGCRSTIKPNVSTLHAGVDTDTDKVIPLALGEDFSCVLNRNHQGLCLGAQTSAPNSPERWQTLHAVGSKPGLKSLVARGTVACAAGASPPSLENRVLCWQPDRSRSPARVDQDTILFSSKLPAPIRSLALQKDEVCALFVDGQVGCAELSNQDHALKFSPVKGLRAIRSLRSGDAFSCGVRGDSGAIFCWGDNSQGQLGLGSSLAAEDEAVAIAGFSGFATAVGVGSQHACAINQAGEVFCWGMNSDQQLAVEGEKHVEPQPVRGLVAKAKALALGEKHSCALLTDGSVWCWGAREAMGSDTQGGLIPVRVPLPAASSMLVASFDRTCAQLSNGSFYCWGEEPERLNFPIN